MFKKTSQTILVLTALTLTILSNQVAQADLTVYTDRLPARLQKAADLFSLQTGEKVVFVEGAYNDFKTRLQNEGPASAADLVITKDLVNLTDLKKNGLLQKIQGVPALERVHAQMVDLDQQWTAISFRARTAIYDPSRVSASDLTSYQDLADVKWAGRLCVRTSNHAYNEALVSGLIARLGLTATESVLQGWMSNLAEAPFSGDTAVIEAIAQGRCEVGIVNHYYLAEAVRKNPSLNVKIAYLDQNGQGVLTNGAGVGFVKTSQNYKAVSAFIEILLSENIQLEFSAAHFDYPVIKGLGPSTFIKDWGPFKMDSVSWSVVGQQVDSARSLIKAVGYK